MSASHGTNQGITIQVCIYIHITRNMHTNIGSSLVVSINTNIKINSHTQSSINVYIMFIYSSISIFFHFPSTSYVLYIFVSACIYTYLYTSIHEYEYTSWSLCEHDGLRISVSGVYTDGLQALPLSRPHEPPEPWCSSSSRCDLQQGSAGSFKGIYGSAFLQISLRFEWRAMW